MCISSLSYVSDHLMCSEICHSRIIITEDKKLFPCLKLIVLLILIVTIAMVIEPLAAVAGTQIRSYQLPISIHDTDNNSEMIGKWYQSLLS